MNRAFSALDRIEPWQDAVSAALFAVDSAAETPEPFSGQLRVFDMGSTSVIQMASGAVRYRRERCHLAAEREETVLVSFATRSEITYSQGGIELTCKRNQCLLERSQRPSLFVQPQRRNEVWVLKVPMRLLKQRLRGIDRLDCLVAEAGSGAGGLLHDMVRLTPARLGASDGRTREAVGRSLIDLLALAIEDDVRVLSSRQSAVRQGHLARIEAHVRRNLADPDLSAERIAAACGISVRYLHDLFGGGDGPTLAQWIRECRLDAARDLLADPARADAMAEVARRFGFGDQAQFARHFRRRFGQAPRDFRAAARL
ncbi:helix-turn-helix domain-containing protein [Zavarzinia sp.]|uniref:helix-turn-helix domain-containing protein n=1 Tax=Zavarzinia sp. TaxID=2027920 RepID=UPI003562220A